MVNLDLYRNDDVRKGAVAGEPIASLPDGGGGVGGGEDVPWIDIDRLPMAIVGEEESRVANRRLLRSNATSPHTPVGGVSRNEV